MVYNGDFDRDGNLTSVYLNDSGTGRQSTLKVDDFMAAANGQYGLVGS